MIYLDVTGSCKAAKNTGIQRMTRSIYAHLRERLAVTPIAWNKVGIHYQHLGRREMRILKAPFRIFSRATAKPEWRGETVFSELHRLVFRKRVRLNEVALADVLLVPDFYSDIRTKCLPELIAKMGVPSVAIFHDAAALRSSKLSCKARRRFRDYLESLAAFDLVICVSQESRDDLLRRWNEYGTTPTTTYIERWPIEFDLA